MSSNLRPLLRSLLNGIASVQAPVFYEAELDGIDADGFRLLTAKRVLRKTGIPEFIDDPELGLRRVQKLGKRYVLVNEASPGADWIPVEEKALRQVKFDHVAMMRWIGNTNSMSGESSGTGSIWTVGTTVINEQRCRVLYFPGTSSKEALLMALGEFEQADFGLINLLIVPAAVALTKEHLVRSEAKGIFIEPLYKLVSDEGIALSLARLPNTNVVREPGSYFRQNAGGWEVGLDTIEPRAVLDREGMRQIWFLLRHPGEEFTAVRINDELNGHPPDDRVTDSSQTGPQRSSGTKARSIADLPPEVKEQIKELRRDMVAARDAGNDRELRDADEEYRHILKKYGVQDAFAGQEKREGDDRAKEARTMAKAINRAIKALATTPEFAALAKHLTDNLKAGARFCYDPPEIPRWRT